MNAPENTVFAIETPDLNEILSYMKFIQPHLNRDIKLLHWQFLEAPVEPGKMLTLRKISDRSLVAIYGIVSQKVWIRDQVLPARACQDTMTHPDHRGKGYLHFLVDRVTQGMRDDKKISYIFPNEHSHRSFKRTGWHQLCLVPSRHKKVTSTNSAVLKTEFYEVTGDFEPCITDIWVNSQMVAGVYRSAEFLNWRYRRPGEVYRKFILGKNQGYLILKLFDRGEAKTLHILDLVVQNRYFEDLVPEALRFSEKFAIENGADQITAWMDRDHKYAKHLNVFELNMAERPERFIYLEKSNLPPELLDSKLWHFSQGDSDVY